MSRQIVVAVLDSVVGSFNRPFYVPSKGAAIRAFTDEVNRVAVDNAMNNHPNDFALYFLGYFNETDGMFEYTETSKPELLTRASDVLVKS